MKIINKADKKEMIENMKVEATKKFNACNPEKCPQCHVSDG